MRLIHVISSYDVFGPEKTVINECLALAERGWECTLINIWEEEDIPFTEKAIAAGVSYRCLTTPKKLDFAVIKRLRDIFRDSKAELVHSHGYKADLYSLLSAFNIQVPLVTTVHGWTSENLKVRFYERLQVFIWRYFQKVICVSKAYREVARSYNVPEKKLLVIYNGIKKKSQDMVESKSKVCDRLKISDQKIVIAIIGRLGIEKGHKDFLNAARAILQKRDDVVFVIIGDGAERERLEQYSRDLGIDRDVLFTGHRDDVNVLYCGIDIVGMTSVREGTPNVLLEAMLNEIPVVAMSVGGIPEVIENEEQGILVEPSDVESFTHGLERLISDSKLRKDIGLAARNRIEEAFLFSGRIGNMMELYNGISNQYSRDI